jgi:predicted nuclease of predicted toxin-antitoxin system
MPYRILADEHVDRATRTYLEKLGHDIRFVVDIDGLGQSSTDGEIADYSLQNDLHVLTHDDDFLTDISAADTGGVLYLEDDELSCRQIGDIVCEMASYLPQQDVVVEYVSKNWL